MTVEFKDNNFFNGIKDILIRNDDKLLKIFYGYNGDLYFDIFGSHNKDENGQYSSSFSINQNAEIYQHFENLINSIVNCKVYYVSEIELKLCESSDEIKGIIDNNSVMNEKLRNKESYHKLVPNNNTIIWYSDNIYDEKANKLEIEKNNREITLTFVDNPGDPTFGFGIRICNSGSKYDPFNLCFMNLFNQLQTLNKENMQRKLTQNKTI